MNAMIKLWLKQKQNKTKKTLIPLVNEGRLSLKPA